MTDAKIQAAIDRYDYFLTDLYHERLNPKEPCYEEDLEGTIAGKAGTQPEPATS